MSYLAFSLEIPKSFIGKKIELLAFEEDEKQEESGSFEIKRSSSIEELFKKLMGLPLIVKEPTFLIGMKQMRMMEKTAKVFKSGNS